MNINVIDTVDPWLVHARSILLAMHKNVIEIEKGPNGVDRMVTDIIKMLAGQRISVLRIYAHGYPGAIGIATGHEYEGDLSAIDQSELEAIRPTLQRLTPYFDPQARVELQGCLVAEGSKGEKLLVGLARIWQVRVQASRNELGTGTLQFKGGVIEAEPSGALMCAIPSEFN